MVTNVERVACEVPAGLQATPEPIVPAGAVSNIGLLEIIAANRAALKQCNLDKRGAIEIIKKGNEANE